MKYGAELLSLLGMILVCVGLTLMWPPLGLMGGGIALLIVAKAIEE